MSWLVLKLTRISYWKITYTFSCASLVPRYMPATVFFPLSLLSRGCCWVCSLFSQEQLTSFAFRYVCLPPITLALAHCFPFVHSFSEYFSLFFSTQCFTMIQIAKEKNNHCIIIIFFLKKQTNWVSLLVIGPQSSPWEMMDPTLLMVKCGPTASQPLFLCSRNEANHSFLTGLLRGLNKMCIYSWT